MTEAPSDVTVIHVNVLLTYFIQVFMTSFLVPVAGASQLAPVNWHVCHATGTRISLVPVGFNIAHILFVCWQLTPETGNCQLAPATGTRNFVSVYGP